MRVSALPSVLYTTFILGLLFEIVGAYHFKTHASLSKRGFPFVGGNKGFAGKQKHSKSKSGKKFSPIIPGNGHDEFGSFPVIPSASGPKSNAPSKSDTPTTQSALNPDNIQGDVLFPFDTAKKTYFFFHISNSTQFKKQLGASIHDRITSATEAAGDFPTTALNLGFTVDGLKALGITDNLGDRNFANGQLNDVSAMGDPGTKNWVSVFTTQNVHGVFLVASDTSDNVNSEIQTLGSILGSSISEIYRLQASVRPGDQAGHEHFGFKDGISQPCVTGVHTCFPGQSVVPPGTLILGAQGDSTSRPSWTNGGSMMAFRQLQQLVPEFNSFTTQNAIMMPGFSKVQGAEFLGARMVGRWKDGTPLDLSPRKPDSSISGDSQQINNFTYDHAGEDLSSNQDRCPFSSHIRKTNPRADFKPTNTANHIMRSGIPYGDEVTSQESNTGKTQKDRGLAFVAYQSQIGEGFLFQQQNWANLQSFPFGKNETAGFDAIIGANSGKPRQAFGLDPRDASKGMSLPDFIISKGGAYFFYPPISAIASNGKLAQ